MSVLVNINTGILYIFYKTQILILYLNLEIYCFKKKEKTRDIFLIRDYESYSSKTKSNCIFNF